MTKPIPIQSGVVMRGEAGAALDDMPTRFDMVAYNGGKLEVGGYDVPVVVDLAGLVCAAHVPIVIKHDLDTATTIGQTDADGVVNDGQTLKLCGQLTADWDSQPVAKRVAVMAKKGHVWQASIGAMPTADMESVGPGETRVVNGQTLSGPFLLARRAELQETSILTVGADRDGTKVLMATAVVPIKAEGTIEEEGGFGAWLDKLGLSLMPLSEDAKNVLLKQYAVETADQGSEPIDAAAKGCDAKDKEEDEDEEEDETEEASDKDKTEPKKKDKKKMDASGTATIVADSAAKTELKKIEAAAIKAIRDAETKETSRITAIKAVCKDMTICQKAIAEGWAPIQAENAYLKAQALQHKAPSNVLAGGLGGDSLKAAIQGALIIRAGGKIDHDGYRSDLARALDIPDWLRQPINAEVRQRTMDSAWKLRDKSMVDICAMALQIDGKDVPNTRREMIRAATSGGALGDIFTTNINALLIQKLLEHPDTTQGWTRESDALNFQVMERTRLTKGPRLSMHGRGGKAEDATRSDVMQNYRINRYSQRFQVDEMDLIDDRFQALQDIPNEMGLACSRLRPDLVYSLLMGNPSINKEDGTSSAVFSASQPGSQSNYVSSGAALAQGTLAAALASMFNVLENNVPIRATPTHLIVPAVLFGAAASLLQSPTITVAGTSGSVTTATTDNQLKAMQDAWGMIKIVSDSRLTNGVYDPSTNGTVFNAGSATKWYLASNLTQTIEVAYLRGSGRAPQIRQKVLDDGQWGLAWDVNFDLGAAVIDWHGLYCASA